MMERRTFLTGAAFAALPPATLAGAVPQASSTTPSLESFLAMATPAERARYHSNALMEAMMELHPEMTGWKATINQQHAFAMVVPGYDKNEGGV